MLAQAFPEILELLSAYFSQLTQKPFIKTVLVQKEIGLAWILHHYRLFTLLWDCLHLENDFRYDQNNRFEKEICSKSYEISLLYKSCFLFKFPIHSELLLQIQQYNTDSSNAAQWSKMKLLIRFFSFHSNSYVLID